MLPTHCGPTDRAIATEVRARSGPVSLLGKRPSGYDVPDTAVSVSVHTSACTSIFFFSVDNTVNFPLLLPAFRRKINHCS